MPDVIHAILLQNAAKCAFSSTVSDFSAEAEFNLQHFGSLQWSEVTHWEGIQIHPYNNYHYFSSFKLQNDAWPSYFLASTSAKGYQSHEDWNNPHRTDVTTLDAFTGIIFLCRNNNHLKGHGPFRLSYPKYLNSSTYLKGNEALRNAAEITCLRKLFWPFSFFSEHSSLKLLTRIIKVHLSDKLGRISPE